MQLLKLGTKILGDFEVYGLGRETGTRTEAV